MPDIGEIRKFNEILKSLGNESLILAEKGEKIEDIPLPEDGLPDDLSALLGTPDQTAGDEDTMDFSDSGPESDDLDQLDNIEDFLMPSLDRDDSDLIGEFNREIEPDSTGLSGDTIPPPPGDTLPDDLDLNDLGSSDLEADFALPGDTDQPLSDEIPGVDLSGDDFSLPGDDEGEPGDDFLAGDFTLPDDMDEPPPGDSSLPDEFSLTDSLESPPGDSTFDIPDTDPGTGDFTLPGDLDQPGDDLSLPDEFSLPGDTAPPPGDEILPDEFTIPDLGDQPPADAIPGGPGGEDDFTIDEFSIPGDFDQPPDDASTGGVAGDEFSGDVLDDFSMPEALDSGIPGEKVSEDRDEFVIDEFSLPGIDEDFDIDSLDDDFSGQEPPADKGPDKGVPDTGIESQIQLSDQEFSNLQLTLDNLPRNLKIIVQDIIGKELLSGDSLKELIHLLVAGASPVKIADYVFKSTGQKIDLPKSFEKKTGLDFARERRSLKYIFRENIIPILKVFIPAVVLLGLIIFFVIRLGVIPGQAERLYKKGLEYIQVENKFYLGDETFKEAYRIYPKKKWFYRYAEAYIDKKEYNLAELKYEQLLNLRWKDRKIEFLTNLDEKGIVDYANFESSRLNFRKAETLLNHLLKEEKFNKAGLFAAGDNYLEWARSDPAMYEQARLAFAKLLRTNASRKDIDFRFLRYFIRVDNYEEVQRLKDLYQKNEKIKVDPGVYTELGGYLLERDELDEVRDILERARTIQENIPELHYYLAKYYHQLDEFAAEEAELNYTLYYLKGSAPLNEQQREIQIDTHNRLGKLYFAQDKIIDAEGEFSRAIDLIEKNQQNSILGRKADFGEVYYNLGNIYYYQALDYNTADVLFEKAEENFFQDPDLLYKMGYIDYIHGKYLDALLEFYKAEDEIGDNLNLLYAIGNTLFYRNDFFAAQGYFNHLLNILKRKREAVTTLRVDENPEHLQLINYIMRTYNNLAVTLNQLAQRPRDPARETQALVYLTKSSEQYDLLKRLLLVPETMERDRETRNIAYLNQRHILYPQTGYQLSLYKENPPDTRKMEFKDDWFSLPLY